MCDLSRSRLIAWIDGELEEVDACAVTVHVEGCAGCGEEVRRVRAISRAIGEYSRAAASGARRSNWRWMAAAAAAAVLLAAGLAWMRPGPVPAPPVARIAQPKPPVPQPVLVAVAKTVPKPRRAPAQPVYRGEPGVLVAVPIAELLPVGAAPPGALLVGHMSFDAVGQPARFRVQ